MKNEQNNQAPIQETAAAPHVPGKRRLLKILLCLFVLGTIIFAGAITFLASEIFSEPKQIPIQPLQMQDFRLQQKLIQRLSRELFRKKRRPTARFTIKSAELQSLVRLVDFGLATAKLAGRYDGINLRDFEPEFSKGNVKIVYPMDTKQKWLFGGIIRFDLIGVPTFSNKTLSVSLKECRIGRIPVPEKIAKKILNDLLSELKESKGFETFCTLVKEVRLNPDGTFVITYYPAKLAPVLLF